MLKQLSEQDASFLYLETDTTPQHVGGVSLVELPPDYEGDFYSRYKRHIQGRLHLVPFLHSKLVQLPFDIDRPFWVEDEAIDIDYHVRHHTLPTPGTLEQLEELVARIHSNFLDRTRPLWEFYVIDGLASGQVAIYTKVHHAAMDGTASQLLLHTMYDPTPEPRAVPEPDDEVHHEDVGFQAIAGAIMKHMVQQEVRLAQWIPDVVKAWTNLILPNVNTLRYDLPFKAPHTPKTLFNVVISSQRSYATRSLSLSAVKLVAKATGTKVNDVVLASCSSALRRYLSDKAALPHESMTTLVPISLRDGTPADEVANQNYMFVCSLATDVEDPLERLHAISVSSSEQKRRINGIKNALLPDLTFFGGGALLRGMVDLYTRAKLAERLPPMGNLTISNVPGPPMQLYIVGAKLVTMHPCSIPFHGAAINITCESYMDRLDFGLVACRRTVPDVALLGDYIEDGFAELAGLAASAYAASAKRQTGHGGGHRPKAAKASGTPTTGGNAPPARQRDQVASAGTANGESKSTGRRAKKKRDPETTPAKGSTNKRLGREAKARHQTKSQANSPAPARGKKPSKAKVQRKEPSDQTTKQKSAAAEAEPKHSRSGRKQVKPRPKKEAAEQKSSSGRSKKKSSRVRQAADGEVSARAARKPTPRKVGRKSHAQHA